MIVTKNINYKKALSLGLNKPTRPVRRNPMRRFIDFSEETKKILTDIKNRITRKFPETKVFITGSRVNGDFTDESDYDILVICLSANIDLKQLRGLEFDQKVDIRFPGKNPEGIEIK